MIAMKPETRCKHIVRDMEPLALHNERYCPSVRRMSLRRADWELLRDHPELARAEGFTVGDDGEVRYRGFEIAPTDITHTQR